MGKLLFKDISFGKTDASNELSVVGNEFYLSSFLEYDRYRIEDFLDGKKYFIIGRKGTGKTALLKYLECKYKEDPVNLVIPIRFKSDFDDLDKKGVKAASIIIDEEVIEPERNTKIKSYVLAWKVYLIYQIFKHTESENNEYEVFEKDEKYLLIWKLLEMIYGKEGGSKIVPKISKGSVAVSAGTKGIDASVEFEIELHDGKLNYELTAKKIVDLYEYLVFKRTPVYVLVDELELSVKTKKMRDADIELIRDLILAIDSLNRVSNNKGYEIRAFASVRSDVLESVLSSGYEINKCIEDYGVTVEWFQKGGAYVDSPLLKLLEKKIRASERANGQEESSDIWGTYFETIINRTEVRRFLLNYSWYRPRDIIRMMQYVQEHCKRDMVKVNQEVFDRAVQEYSNRMWIEAQEEMSLKYSSEDIQAIRKLLTGIEVPFNKNDLEKRLEELAKEYDYVESFRKKNKLPNLLETLFAWGIIGNSGERMVFSFLGYRELDILKPMIIHTPLRSYFGVVYRKNVEFR